MTVSQRSINRLGRKEQVLASNLNVIHIALGILSDTDFHLRPLCLVSVLRIQAFGAIRAAFGQQPSLWTSLVLVLESRGRNETRKTPPQWGLLACRNFAWRQTTKTEFGNVFFSFSNYVFWWPWSGSAVDNKAFKIRRLIRDEFSGS